MSAFTHSVFDAVVDVIVDEESLGVGDGAFDGLELLGHFQTCSSFLHIADDAADVTFCPFEALNDIGV